MVLSGAKARQSTAMRCRRTPDPPARKLTEVRWARVERYPRPQVTGRGATQTSSLAADTAQIIEQILTQIGYPGLLFLMVVENLFPPIPSELVLPLVGFLVASSDMQLVPALIVSTGGSTCGALILYGLARWFGEVRLKAFIARYGRWFAVSEASYDRAAGMLRRNSPAILFWSRFVPVVRSVVSLPAGVAGVPLAGFLFWTALSSLCWNAALITAGMVLGENWPRILPVLDRYEAVLLWAGGALVVALLIRHFVINRRRSRQMSGSGDGD